MKNESLNKSTGVAKDFKGEPNIAVARCDSVSERLFPCRSDTEVKNALESLLHSPKVHIEVAGGIVRHNIW
jgi:hypothetical protein